MSKSLPITVSWIVPSTGTWARISHVLSHQAAVDQEVAEVELFERLWLSRVHLVGLMSFGCFKEEAKARLSFLEHMP